MKCLSGPRNLVKGTSGKVLPGVRGVSWGSATTACSSTTPTTSASIGLCLVQEDKDDEMVEEHAVVQELADEDLSVVVVVVEQVKTEEENAEEVIIDWEEQLCKGDVRWVSGRIVSKKRLSSMHEQPSLRRG